MALFEYVNKNYLSDTDVITLLNYIINNSYSFEAPFHFTGSPENLWDQMKFYKKYYLKTDGNLIRHFVFTCDTSRYEKHVTTSTLYSIGLWISDLFKEYQPIFGVHKNTNHWHLHIVVNTVNIITGKKLHIDRSDFHRLNLKIAEIASYYKIALLPYTHYNEHGYLKYEAVPAPFLYENKQPFIYE